MKNKTSRTGLYAVFILVGIMCIYLVSAAISPSLDLNGQNRFTIKNYSEISGIGNISIGSGINFFDIYSDGNTTILDTKGYNITFTDGVHWNELTVYPVACPAGSYLTQLADAVTCTAITSIPNNLTVGTTNNQYFVIGGNTTAMTCGASNYGAIYFDNSTQKHYGCNATGWQGMY